MCSAVTLPCASSPARQLALRDRVVAAVRHVLLARPDQLDRRARHLLGDRHRLAHPVVHRAAPAEAAAEVQLVDLALAPAAGRPLRRSAASAASPFCVGVQTSQRSGVQRAVAFIGSIVAWFWCGYEYTASILRARRGERLVGVAVAGCRRPPASASRPAFSIAAMSALDTLACRADVPLDRQRVERGLRAPPGVGDDRDRAVADLAPPSSRRAASRSAAASKLLTLPPNTGQALIAAFSMPGSLQVHAVDLRAGDLVGGVEARQRLAGELPVLRILQRHVGRRRQLARPPRRPCRRSSCGRCGACVITPLATRAFGGRHLPLVGRRLHQHHARRPRRPCARSRATRGCRGCRRWRSCPRRGCARGSAPGVGYSVVTLAQSHSSSSATSCARPVSVPWPISERAMRMTTVLVGLDDDPGVDLGRRALRAAAREPCRAPAAPSGMPEADQTGAGGAVGRGSVRAAQTGAAAALMSPPSTCWMIDAPARCASPARPPPA